MTLSITPIPCLRDNYAYAIRHDADAWIVDPSEGAPIVAYLERESLTLRGILLTHHHHDHVGGVLEARDHAIARHGDAPWVAAHHYDRERIPGLTLAIDVDATGFVDTDVVVAGRRMSARHIPGHTLGAIAWRLLDDQTGHVFTGDTLFAAGCGRLFEGTPAQMFDSLEAITALPESTQLWFGHEYTAANLRFAAHVEPSNQAIERRITDLGSVTTPTTVALERATNPFVRARDAVHLGELRRHKDDFRA